jgi:hypothetical protein
MPVSGLVVSLRDDPKSRAQALAAISQQTQITMGEVEQNRVAIVVDTTSTQEDKRLWDWLGSLPGVSLLEVAFVGFEQQLDSTKSDSGEIPSAAPLDPTVDGKEDLKDGR